MHETEFDMLCDGASPEETRRLGKILSEWCNGDEHSFPVQLALLTRAQWRAAAHVPNRMHDACTSLEQKLAEHHQRIAEISKSFADSGNAQKTALEAIISTHAAESKEVLTAMQGHLLTAQIVANRIKTELEHGAAEWNKAKTDLQNERQKLDETCRTLEAQINRRDWFWFAVLILGLVGTGIAIGLRIE